MSDSVENIKISCYTDVNKIYARSIEVTEMDAQKLGRKIREARLAKRLTQSEVVGDFITRNMLSQIESGAATPSMKTLEYLSNVLSVPMSQLVPGDRKSTRLNSSHSSRSRMPSSA